MTPSMTSSQIYILDTDIKARRILEAQLILHTNEDVTVEKFDSIDAVETRLDHTVMGIFIDVFRLPVGDACQFIGEARHACPWIVFALYSSHEEWQRRSEEIAPEWRSRFEHYFGLKKDYTDTAFGDEVGNAVQLMHSQYEQYMSDPRIRLLLEHGKSLVGSPQPPDDRRSVSRTEDHQDGEKRVFVSYARANAEFVDWLWQQLEEHGIPTWMDRKDIRPGDIWDDKVNEGLHRCGAMVLVQSPDSVSSPNVSKEWKFFMSVLKRPIVPVLLRDCTPHFQLIHLQHVDFRQNSTKAIGELVTSLRTLLSP